MAAGSITGRSALAVAALLAWPLSAQPPAGLEGIWVAERLVGPAAPIPVRVDRSGAGWRLRAGTAEAQSEGLRFTLRGGGEFRGRLEDRERLIRGFWLSPARSTDPSRPFATSVTLRRTRAGEWRGEIRPLPDSFTLYLRVFRDDNGRLVGAFRNPDRNSRGDAARYAVAEEGGNIRMTAGEAVLATRIAPDRLRIAWPEIGTLELVHRPAGQAPAYFPRPPGAPLYAYRRPAATSDGWRTARGRELGIDEAALAGFVRRLAAADPAAPRASLIHSVLVAYRGRLVLEEYFYGFERDTTHDLRSAGKTYASVLLGAAMMRGLPLGPEAQVYDLLGGVGSFAHPDPRKARITLGHLMTHTSGLACDDNEEASPGNEDRMSGQSAQPDWWRYTLDLPMAYEPGTHYAYCSANTNLTGAALTRATGTWLPEFFDRAVAQPLQFGPYHWNLMPSGEGYLGGGAYIRPRDLLKLGQAYLDGGVWNGRRIVEAAWVARSTIPVVEINPATTGLDPEEFSNRYFGGADGYAWHPGTVEAGGRSYRTYGASGNGGQLLIVVPELDLAIVFTAENYRQGFIWGRWQNDLVGGAIIPALPPARR